MWVRMTRVKMNPDSLDEARALYNSDEISGVISLQPGYRFHHLMENVDVEGDGISITAWDSQADSDAYEASGTYQKLVGEFSQYMTAPPELSTYEVKD